MELRYIGADLAHLMRDMRIWFDHNGSNLKNFTIHIIRLVWRFVSASR